MDSRINFAEPSFLADEVLRLSFRLHRLGRMVFFCLLISVALLAIGLAIGADDVLIQRLLARLLVGSALGFSVLGLVTVWRFDDLRKRGDSIRLELNYSYQQLARDAIVSRFRQIPDQSFEEIPEVREAFRRYAVAAELPFTSGQNGIVAFVVAFIGLAVLAGALFPTFGHF